MNQQGQFDLCPKCGALARDGVCQSCGYEIPEVKEAMEKAAQARKMSENKEGLANPYAINGQYSQTDSGSVNHSYNNPYSSNAVPQSNKYTWLIIGMILGAAVMALIGFAALLYCATKFF